MIEWLREWNVDHRDDSVHFFGFDNQQPDQDGAALRAFLEQLATCGMREGWNGIRRRRSRPGRIPGEEVEE